jgi:hypothetical protein
MIGKSSTIKLNYKCHLKKTIIRNKNKQKILFFFFFIMATKFYEEIIIKYKNLYETKVGYDVKIYAGEKQDMKEFHVHSLILQTQSDYFKSAFEKDIIQKKDGYYILNSNNSPNVYEILLRYFEIFIIIEIVFLKGF